jgi:glutaredoxin-like protein
MAMLKEQDKEEVRKQLAELANPVQLVMFTQTIECEFCEETRELVEEVASLSDQVEATIYNFVTDKDKAEEHGVDKIPAVVVIGERDYGIRFYGIPAGYEFASLMEAIKMVAARQAELSEATREALEQIDEPLHFQVFVTPTCPYCPRMVVLVHRMAIENDYVIADMIEATEFPHLAINYQVRGVPRTVINETHSVEGMVPEALLVQHVLLALGKQGQETTSETS